MRQTSSGKTTAGLIEMFGAAKARGLGSDNLEQIAANAVAARVATLLVDADRVIPGRLDVTTGEIEFGELANPKVDDLIDDVAELVLKNGGQVVVVPKERMPASTGVAAICRF